MTTVQIPDGLCDHLHQVLGGDLKAPALGNPCGHARDSSFTIYPTAPVSDDKLVQMVLEYYRRAGLEIESRKNLAFFILAGGKDIFHISLSNDGYRILGSTNDM